MAYTLAGVMTSTLVGASLGWLGRLFLPPHVGGFGLLIAIAVALIAMARELGWLALPLPQFKRQTKDFWAKVFPGTVAATLWGLDLGLIFTTYLTFSGVWLLVVIAILSGESMFGAALFALYWLGRALSVWIAPLLMPNAGATSQFLDRVYGQRHLFQRIHVLGLAWSVIVLIAWLIHETPI